jgi:hypothetical protein
MPVLWSWNCCKGTLKEEAPPFVASNSSESYNSSSTSQHNRNSNSNHNVTHHVSKMANFNGSTEEKKEQDTKLLVTADTPFVKNLWLYWEQGIDHLASLAAKKGSKYKADFACVQALKQFNPTWNIRILAKKETMKLAPAYASLAGQTRPPGQKHWKLKEVHMSDLLRLELLTLYGGVWADTSICPF